MKKFERPRTSRNSQPRRPANFGRKDQTVRKANGLKPLNAAQLVSKVLDATAEPSVSVNDSTSESSEVYDNINVHYMDDARSSENVCQDTNEKMRNDENLEDCEEGKVDESDSGTNKDSVSSSQGDFFAAEDTRSDSSSIVSKSTSFQDGPRTSKGRTDAENVRSRSNTLHGTPRKSTKASKCQAKVTTNSSSHKTAEYEKASSKFSHRSSEAITYKPFEEAKEDDIWEDAVNDAHTAESDNEAVVVKENKSDVVEGVLTQKIRTLEARIEELEEELREVAALEISLYSVFPEHGSSADKLHKPARHLSRLYMLARKNQTENKLITVSKNIVSGLFLVSNSCGTDVPRLTFWWSNIVVLREIISQAFRDKNANISKPLEEDWKDAETLLVALRKLESFVFTRAVDSIWSQVMMIHVKPQGRDASVGKEIGGKQFRSAQGSVCVTLWENAFEEALQRLCPFRAGWEKCGCLPVLTRMVMEQCIARLDVAMFNAILRESAHQIPTDPVSDPISDPRVLPIPAGVLSFESGVKLKTAVGYWSRLLMDIHDIDVNGDSLEAEQHNRGANNHVRRDGPFKPFKLLNELSDLLMLPKDLLVDRSTRNEVCPSIGLRLIKRILCNFTPDEFCPDPVPGTVLEELNAQSILEGRSNGNPTTGFPRQAAPVSYTPPSSAHLTEMAAEFSLKLQSSMTRKKGYTSDEEVEMKSPLAYITRGVDKQSGSPREQSCFPHPNNNRYRFFQQIWLL